MNETNHHSLLKGMSVTVQKGNFSVTIGPKQSPAPKSIIMAGVPSPDKIGDPVHFQDVVFVLVVVALIAVIARHIYI